MAVFVNNGFKYSELSTPDPAESERSGFPTPESADSDRDSVMFPVLTMDYETTFTEMAIRRFQRRWLGVRHSGGGAGMALCVFSTLILGTLVSAYYRESFYVAESGVAAVRNATDTATFHTRSADMISKGLYLVVPYSTLVASVAASLLYVVVVRFSTLPFTSSPSCYTGCVCLENRVGSWAILCYLQVRCCRIEWLFRWLFYFFVLLLMAHIAVLGRVLNGEVGPSTTSSSMMRKWRAIRAIRLGATNLPICYSSGRRTRIYHQHANESTYLACNCYRTLPLRCTCSCH